MRNVKEYINQLLQYEEYSFTWEELKKASSKTDTALKNELARLVGKKEIINLRQGFYLILSPRYRTYEKLPIELYVEKLFKYLDKPYYVAFYSAAALHGASHQQVQKDYLITKVPNIRDIKKGGIHLDIAATSTWPPKNIQQKKSDAGYFNISSPVLSAVDLIYYQTKLGGLNRILSVISELIEEINMNDILELLTWYPHTSVVQRLGYILETLHANQKILDQIKKTLEMNSFYPVLLSPDNGTKPGKTGNPWKVDANIKLESDL